MSSLLGAQFRTRIAISTEAFEYVEFDALVSITYAGEAEVTDHPIELSAGAIDVSDHVRRRPKQLTLNGIVTNTPIMALASFRATSAVSGDTLIDLDSRAEGAFTFLEGIKDAGLLVHVLATAPFDFDNMIITSLGCTRDARRGNIVDISLTLREIQIATTEIIDAPKAVGKPTSLGRKNKTDSDPATAAKTATLLQKFFSLFGI